MDTKVSKLIGAIRSINRSKRHEIKIDGDDDVCYWQRKEWVDWILELANEAEAEMLTHNKLDEPRPTDNKLNDAAYWRRLDLNVRHRD